MMLTLSPSTRKWLISLQSTSPVLPSQHNAGLTVYHLRSTLFCAQPHPSFVLVPLCLIYPEITPFVISITEATPLFFSRALFLTIANITVSFPCFHLQQKIVTSPVHLFSSFSQTITKGATLTVSLNPLCLCVCFTTGQSYLFDFCSPGQARP